MRLRFVWPISPNMVPHQTNLSIARRLHPMQRTRIERETFPYISCCSHTEIPSTQLRVAAQCWPAHCRSIRRSTQVTNRPFRLILQPPPFLFISSLPCQHAPYATTSTCMPHSVAPIPISESKPADSNNRDSVCRNQDVSACCSRCPRPAAYQSVTHDGCYTFHCVAYEAAATRWSVCMYNIVKQFILIAREVVSIDMVHRAPTMRCTAAEQFVLPASNLVVPARTLYPNACRVQFRACTRASLTIAYMSQNIDSISNRKHAHTQYVQLFSIIMVIIMSVILRRHGAPALVWMCDVEKSHRFGWTNNAYDQFTNRARVQLAGECDILVAYNFDAYKDLG